MEIKKISDILKGTEFEEMIEIFEISNFKTVNDINKVLGFGSGTSVAQILDPIFNEIMTDKKSKIKLYGIIQKEVDLFRKKDQSSAKYLMFFFFGLIMIFLLFLLWELSN
jgi:hypothetical protein